MCMRYILVELISSPLYNITIVFVCKTRVLTLRVQPEMY